MTYRSRALDHYGHRCDECGAECVPLDVHHADRDSTNNEINNLQVLCEPCHVKVHRAPEDQTVERRTYPTICITVKRQHYDWLDTEAKRRKVSKSVVVRELLQAAMARPSQAAAAQ